jgi:hypothetical protein
VESSVVVFREKANGRRSRRDDLMYAACEGHIDVARLLLDRACGCQSSRQNDITPLLMAISK